VPSNYNGEKIPPGGGKVVIEDCHIVIYVTRKELEILTAIKVPITINK
jgi:ribosomal protein L24E